MTRPPRTPQTGFAPARRLALLALASVLCCAACGQRGPLYLPESEPAAKPGTETTAPDPEEREAADDDATA